jgi:hypothetical protein
MMRLRSASQEEGLLDAIRTTVAADPTEVVNELVRILRPIGTRSIATTSRLTFAGWVGTAVFGPLSFCLGSNPNQTDAGVRSLGMCVVILAAAVTCLVAARSHAAHGPPLWARGISALNTLLPTLRDPASVPVLLDVLILMESPALCDDAVREELVTTLCRLMGRMDDAQARALTPPQRMYLRQRLHNRLYYGRTLAPFGASFQCAALIVLASARQDDEAFQEVVHGIARVHPDPRVRAAAKEYLRIVGSSPP